MPLAPSQRAIRPWHIVPSMDDPPHVCQVLYLYYENSIIPGRSDVATTNPRVNPEALDDDGDGMDAPPRASILTSSCSYDMPV